jgi:oxysterol-binding protein-related protein 8
LLFDKKSNNPSILITKPISEQQDNESLRLWSKCIQALKDGNNVLATTLKSEIEENQRSIRKMRKESGNVWIPKYFEFASPSENDLEGTTKRDQNHGNKDELGHWILK